MIIDEVITFFLAGMKTIQVTTTNLIYYLTKHKDHKRTLLKEVLPPIEQAEKNIVDELTTDTVMEYNFLQ